MKRVTLCVFLLSALGSIPAGLAQVPAVDTVPEYSAGALAPAEYRVIWRISASSWITAITPRTFADQPAARTALLNEAARRGGDGVINLHCLRSGGVGGGALLPGHYCYGSVIKLAK